jgi:polyisoprenoid-binding protein YceI
MKTIKTLLVLVVLAISTLSFKPAPPASWKIDKNHAKLTFTITHMMVSDVEGSFKIFDANISAPGADFANASVDFTASTSSLSTDNDMRDQHVKSDAFLDVAKYPTITFKSTAFKKIKPNAYKVTGNLTIHGITKPVILNATTRTGEDTNHKVVVGFKIDGIIKRSDFGIGTGFGAKAVGDEVTLHANTEFAKG